MRTRGGCEGRADFRSGLADPGDAGRRAESLAQRRTPTLLRTYSRLFYVTLSECASGTPRSSRSTCSTRADGQPYRLHRRELPDSHPQRSPGLVHDDLALDAAGRVAPRVDTGQELDCAWRSAAAQSAQHLPAAGQSAADRPAVQRHGVIGGFVAAGARSRSCPARGPPAAVRGHPAPAVAELVVLMSGVEAAGAHFPIRTGWRDATTTGVAPVTGLTAGSQWVG